MYNLCVDIGNSWIKGAYFNQSDEIEHTFLCKNPGEKLGRELNRMDMPIQYAIVSNVRKLDIKTLPIKAEKVLDMNPSLDYPFDNRYNSPETLGMDRVCAISGALKDFPNQALLVITAGTCVTYNILTEDGLFLGGSISPGLTMRYKALHNYTGKLPLVNHTPFDNLIGMTTKESLWSGVQKGLRAELDGIIDQYKSFYPDIKVIMTGGATIFFENKVKNEIFADPNLIFKGLNTILKRNVK